MGGPRISPATRAAVEAALAEPGAIRNRIAAEHGIATGTVSRIAQEMRDRGEPVGIDRAATKTATAAAAADARALMAALKLRFIAVANRALAELDEPVELIELSKAGVWCRLPLERPDINGRRQLVTTAAIATDKAVRLDVHGAGDGDASPIEQLAAAVSAVWQEIRPPTVDTGHEGEPE